MTPTLTLQTFIRLAQLVLTWTVFVLERDTVRVWWGVREDKRRRAQRRRRVHRERKRAARRREVFPLCGDVCGVASRGDCWRLRVRCVCASLQVSASISVDRKYGTSRKGHSGVGGLKIAFTSFDRPDITSERGWPGVKKKTSSKTEMTASVQGNKSKLTRG